MCTNCQSSQSFSFKRKLLFTSAPGARISHTTQAWATCQVSHSSSTVEEALHFTVSCTPAAGTRPIVSVSVSASKTSCRRVSLSGFSAELRGCCTGATLGGGQGLATAVRTRPDIGVDSTRLRLNRMLNLSGKTGRSAGNALGCLGLFYAASESGLDYVNDGRLPDLLNSLGAGMPSIYTTLLRILS